MNDDYSVIDFGLVETDEATITLTPLGVNTTEQAEVILL